MSLFPLFLPPTNAWCSKAGRERKERETERGRFELWKPISYVSLLGREGSVGDALLSLSLHFYEYV